MSRQEQCGLECRGSCLEFTVIYVPRDCHTCLTTPCPLSHTLPQLLLCFSLSHARARKGQRGHEALTNRKA